jgi:tetratricopeptide (TPR) repeat protein
MRYSIPSDTRAARVPKRPNDVEDDMAGSVQYARIFELRDTGRTEEAIHYAEELLTGASNPDDIGALLTCIVSLNMDLGRLVKARCALQRLKGLEIPDVEVRLNSEFMEPCLLDQEGRTEEGLIALVAMLDREGRFIHDDRCRYLYQHIQRRRAWALFELSRFAEALPIVRESMSYAFEEVSDEQRMRWALGLCLEETGDSGRAVDEYFRVIGFNLRNEFEEQARCRLATLLVGTRAFAQARKQLEFVLEEFSDRAPVVPRSFVYGQLSIVCRCLGDQANSERYRQLANTAEAENG